MAIQEALPNFPWLRIGTRRFSVVERNEAVNVLLLGLRRLVAAACVHLVNPVAIEGGDLEVNPPKLDDVSDSDDLLLIVREEVL